MPDMMGAMFRGMGIDPDAILQQARDLGAAFATMNVKLDVILANQARMEANQTAVMVALGLMAPQPSEAAAALIAAESRRYVDGHGGLAPAHGADDGPGDGVDAIPRAIPRLTVADLVG